MNINDLRRELEDQPMPEPLDPEILVGRAEARERSGRRTRRLIVVGAAVVAVALGLTTAVRSGWLGTGTQSYVAGQPTGTPTIQAASAAPSTGPTGSAVVVTTSPTGGGVAVTPLGTIPATGVIPALPYVAVGDAPAVRSIPDNTWVEVIAGTWVATWKTKITVVEDTSMPAETPQAACDAGAGTFGCRGTVGNTNRSGAFSGVQASSSETLTVASSSFSGSPTSTRAILPDGTAYWGVLWRLDGVAGWTFAVWTTPSVPLPSSTPGLTAGYPYSSPTYKIYDAAGTVTGSFPA